MEFDTAIREFEAFATGLRAGEIAVHRAAVALDERQDGEPVTRAVLLLDEPHDDTWNVESIQELRTRLAHKATDLQLPPVSLTLVPESEAEAVEAFTRE